MFDILLVLMSCLFLRSRIGFGDQNFRLINRDMSLLGTQYFFEFWIYGAPWLGLKGAVLLSLRLEIQAKILMDLGVEPCHCSWLVNVRLNLALTLKNINFVINCSEIYLKYEPILGATWVSVPPDLSWQSSVFNQNLNGHRLLGNAWLNCCTSKL